jgi:hypothetical protein
VDKYLSPLSGNNTTIFLPLFSSLCANSLAAYNAAPDEIPMNTPSLLTTSAPVLNASSLETVIISS